MKEPMIAHPGNAILRFFLAPAEAKPLAAFRIGLSAVLLTQAVFVSSAYFGLYERSSFLQGPVQDELARSGLPTLGWLVGLFSHYGVSDTRILAVIASLYVLSLGSLLIGFLPRIAAAIAWFTHLIVMTTGQASNYGADIFANLFLFYLILMPSGDAFSVTHHSREPSWQARLALRVIQIHLCIVYLTSGLAKAAGLGWWNGNAMWETLTMPDFSVFDFTWIASYPWLAVLMGWGVLLVEIGYAVFIWPRRTRLLWVALITALHLGIMIFMGLYVFGAIMIVFTTTTFAISAEPKLGPVQAQT